jgi:hypothetical protein
VNEVLAFSSTEAFLFFSWSLKLHAISLAPDRTIGFLINANINSEFEQPGYHRSEYIKMTTPKSLNNTYHAPKAPYLKPILICGAVMALLARREVISPGSPLYDYVLSRSPHALKAGVWIQNGLFYFLYGAHGIETAMFTKRLSEHGVSVMSLAWWKWMATCFVGGKFCFEHFDKVAGRKAA